MTFCEVINLGFDQQTARLRRYIWGEDITIWPVQPLPYTISYQPTDTMEGGFKKSIKIYRRLFRYLSPYTGKLAISVLAMIGVAVMTAASALLIKNVLDDVFINGDREMLLLVPLAIIVIYFLKGFFRYVRTYLMSWTGLKIVQDIRNELYQHH